MDQYLICFLACENIILDVNHRFSVINNFDRIFIDQYPAIYPFQIFTLYKNNEGFHKFRISVIKPGEEEKDIFTQEYVSALPEKKAYGMPVALQIEKPGIFQLNTYLDDKLFGITEITVEPKSND